MNYITNLFQIFVKFQHIYIFLNDRRKKYRTERLFHLSLHTNHRLSARSCGYCCLFAVIFTYIQLRFYFRLLHIYKFVHLWTVRQLQRCICNKIYYKN